jgi:hypothetical protein
MKPIFKSFCLSVVLCCICLSGQAASSHELKTPTLSAPSFEQEMLESMGKMDQGMAAATDLEPQSIPKSSCHFCGSGSAGSEVRLVRRMKQCILAQD